MRRRSLVAAERQAAEERAPVVEIGASSLPEPEPVVQTGTKRCPTCGRKFYQKRKKSARRGKRIVS